ncbi:unnamed protein product [Bubo scandiacus]
MCDCFHLVLPNWPGSPASGSGRQLRPAEPPGDADADADAEDEDSVNEVAVEDIRPRPQGSSPVYEYSIEEEYLKLQEENKKYSTDKSKQSQPQETMEVTLKTEVEAGASGFSVMGGGNEGIFIKKVLKESPASKIFSLREGDQLLSATIFFDNIKYEDALKILQYSEPYRVQFSLKRKIAGKEELEHIHSTVQYKKERISQEKELSESIPEETVHVSGKAISEEDRETLIVSQRVGRSKRPKKDRLSWPKFQSIKNKKILGHRRSHSTSDAYEPAIQDISPTSTDTESQFQQEVRIKEKKGSQKKLKFPSIGFKMHRSKPEPQDKQKKEIKTTLLSEREKTHKEDISLENPEILTVEYTTSPAYETKTGEVHETLTKELKDMKNGIPSHTKKRPEVEISIKKDKESTSKFAVPEVPAVTTQISKPSLEAPDLKESPTKQTLASSKSRKKKQKEPADKTEGESGINIDMMGHTAQGSIQVKGLEIGTAKAELHTTSDTLETKEKEAEDTQILTIQKTKFGISMPKRKETETENAKPRGDVPHSVPEKRADTSSEDGSNLDVKLHMPDAESEVSTWKIQMPSFKISKTPKADVKIPREESTVESVDATKKPEIEEDDTPTTDKILKIDIGMKAGEKDIEGKESKFRLPKFKLPTFTWATTKDETGQTEDPLSDREGKLLEVGTKPEMSVSAEEMKIPSAEIEIGISKGKTSDKNIGKTPEGHIPSLKTLTMKTSTGKNNLEEKDGEILITKPDIEITKGEISIVSKKTEELSENRQLDIKAPKADIKAPKVDISLPSVDATGLKGKFKMPKFDKPKFGVSLPKTEGPEGDVSLPSAEADIKAPKVDISLPSVDVTLPKASVDLQAPELEAAGLKGKFKMPKFDKPKFGVSLPKTEGPEGDVSLPSAEADIKAPKVDISLPSVDATGLKGKFKMPKFDKPKFGVSLPKTEGPEGDVSLPSAEADIKAPKVDISLPSVDAAGLKGKFKMPKFDKPKFGVSLPKTEGPEGDVSLPSAEADIKAPKVDISLPSVDVTLPKASVDLQAPELEAAGLKGKFKMPKFDKPKFGVSLPKTEGPEGDVSLPSAEADIKAPKVDISLPSVDATGLKGKFKMPKFDKPKFGVSLPKTEGPEGDVSLPSAEADIKAPKVDISLPSVDVTLPKASVDLQAPELEAAGLKGKFKMPKFDKPKFGVSLPKTEGPEGDVSLPSAEVELPSATVTAAGEVPALGLKADVPGAKAEGAGWKLEKPSLKMPKADIKAPKVDISLPSVDAAGLKGKFKMPKFDKPKFGVSLPKTEGPEGDVSLPSAEADIKAPKVDISLPSVDAAGLKGKFKMPKFDKPKFGVSLPKTEGPEGDVSLPSAEVELPSATAPEIDLKVPSAEGSLDGAELEAAGLKGKFKMPKFDKPKFGVSLPKTEGPEGDISLPSAEVELPSATVTAAGEGPALGLKADVPGAKAEGAGWKLEKPSLKMPKADIKAPKVDISLPSVDVTLPKASLEKPSLKMPKADIKAPKVDISLPSVDVTLPKASVDLQAPEAALTLEGEAKAPEKEAAKTKDGKFKMPKFGMPSFGWSSSREAKGTVAADVDVSLKEPQVTVPSGTAEVDVPSVEGSLEIQAPEIDLKVPSAEGSLDGAELEAAGLKGKFKMPKFDKPKFGVSLPKTEGPEGDVSLPSAEADIKAPKVDISLPSVDLEGPEGKIKMPKFQKPKFGISLTKGKGPEPEISSPKIEAELPQLKTTNESADIAVGVPAPELTSDMSDPGVVAEIAIGKEGIPKVGDSVKSSDASLSKIEGDISLSTEKTDRVNIPETYADIVKRGAEGQKMHTSEFIVSSTELSKSYLSASEIDKDNSLTNRFPMCTLTPQEHKVKSQDIEVPKVERSTKLETSGVGLSIKIPKLKIPRFTFKVLPIEADVSVSKVVTDPKGSTKSKILTLNEPDIKTAQMTTTVESSPSNAGQDIHWSYVEGQEVSEKVEPEHVAIERCEIYTTEILKESEILSSEVKTATLGFSLLKVKLPESHSNLEVLVQQPSSTEGISSPEGITAGPLSKDEDVAEALEDEEKDITNEKEKTDSKRSPGRFKFWLPSIGFSSSGDETSTDSKTEVKKSVPEDVKPADTSDNDSSKQTEKTGWFKFPKLGFTSPSKKAKTVDKEEMGHKEGRISDEDSPSDKPDIFFDAQESLSPKETTEGEKVEIDGASSNVPVSRTIVTSSARTELILLEEEKDSQANIPGDTTK